MSNAESISRVWRTLACAVSMVGVALVCDVSPLHAQDAGTKAVASSGDEQARSESAATSPGQVLIDKADRITDVALVICDMKKQEIDSTVGLTDEEIAAIRKDVASAEFSTSIPATPAAWHITVVFELESGRAFSAIPVGDGFIVDDCEPCEIKRVDSSGSPVEGLGFVVPKLEDAGYWGILESHLGRPSKEYRTPRDMF
jgi:hypothetical protein